MRADFLNKVTSNLQGSGRLKTAHREMWVKSLDHPKVKAQLKANAKTAYVAQQAQIKPSKWAVGINLAFNAAAAGKYPRMQILFTYAPATDSGVVIDREVESRCSERKANLPSQSVIRNI